MAAARKKRPPNGPSRRREDQRVGGPAWDPAAVPAKGGDGDGPTSAEQEERAYHATHFTADPRGAVQAGSPPPSGDAQQPRSGTPPTERAGAGDDAEAPAKHKRLGGPPSPRSGPSDV
jgi:hypothetical protein